MESGINRYCKLRNLRNESDVEQNFLVRLLDDIGFTADYRESKATLQPVGIDKGKRRKLYIPDYVCYLDKGHKHPALVIDAKSPKEDSADGLEDAQLYTSVIRRKLPPSKPEQFCIGSNALSTVVAHYDSDDVRYNLLFDDINDGNPAFEAFKTELRRGAIAYKTPHDNDFVFRKPKVVEIRSLFESVS